MQAAVILEGRGSAQHSPHGRHLYNESVILLPGRLWSGTARGPADRVGGASLTGVALRRSLSNPSTPLRSLIARSQRKTRSPIARPGRPSRRDQRGPVATKALKSQTRLSYPQRQELLDAYASGMPVQQIEERFEVHRTTITRIASRSGVTMRNRPSPAPRSQPTSLLGVVEHPDPGIHFANRVLE